MTTVRQTDRQKIRELLDRRDALIGDNVDTEAKAIAAMLDGVMLQVDAVIVAELWRTATHKAFTEFLGGILLTGPRPPERARLQADIDAAAAACEKAWTGLRGIRDMYLGGTKQ